MNKDTKESTFKQLFSVLSQFSQQLKDLDVDRYIKKLATMTLIKILSFAQLKQEESLRSIVISLNSDELKKEIGIDSISASTLSRRQESLDTNLLELMFRGIIADIGCKSGFNNITKQIGRLHLIDASVIKLCLNKYPWASYRKTKGGIKIHLRLCFSGDGYIPDKVIVTPAKPSDKTQMDDLVVADPDALNVFDRGYVDYKKFDDYCERGIRFVTRLKSNAIIEVVKENPVTLVGPIEQDQIVLLGEGKNRMQNALRLIKTRDSENNPIIILTNDFLASAEEIGDIYRYRWQIEVFFKWLKQHFKVKRFYGVNGT